MACFDMDIILRLKHIAVYAQLQGVVVESGVGQMVDGREGMLAIVVEERVAEVIAYLALPLPVVDLEF